MVLSLSWALYMWEHWNATSVSSAYVYLLVALSSFFFNQENIKSGSRVFANFSQLLPHLYFYLFVCFFFKTKNRMKLFTLNRTKPDVEYPSKEITWQQYPRNLWCHAKLSCVFLSSKVSSSIVCFQLTSLRYTIAVLKFALTDCKITKGFSVWEISFLVAYC